MSAVIAKAKKESAESALGVAFSRENPDSPLKIHLIRDDSIFASTDLKPGMIVGDIMGETMTWKTPADAAAALKGAPAGFVSITAAEPVLGEITRQQAAEKMAISVQTKPDKPGVFIRKIYPTGPFAGSELAEGQQLVSINGKPCPSDTKQAIDLVMRSQSRLKIVAIPVATPAADEREETEATRGLDVVEEKTIIEEKAVEETVVEELFVEQADSLIEQQEKGLFDQIFATCIC